MTRHPVLAPQSIRSALLNRMPDWLFVSLLFYKHHRRLPNIFNPQTYPDKIQWLKVHGKLERFAPYVDKFTVRSHIADKIGAEYLVPLIGVWDTFGAIPFASLPDRFVLKATHGCEYNFICKDKAAIDMPSLRATVEAWLRQSWYKLERERQYKNCRRRIIVEQYLEDDSGALRDYKFWCSKGKVKMIQVDVDRFTGHKSILLDANWQRRPGQATSFTEGKSMTIPKPSNALQMAKLAEALAIDFPFVRVDLYSVGKKIYFGELTFTPGSGFVRQDSIEDELELGRWVDLESYKAAKKHKLSELNSKKLDKTPGLPDANNVLA